MKRFTSFLLILSGTIFSLFIFVVGMYAMVPGFRDTVTRAIGRDGDIPVVSGDDSFEEDSAAQLVTEIEEEEEVALSSGEGEALFREEGELTADDAVSVEAGEITESGAVADEAKESDTERLIVDKEYHEDCGTGEGYWVITYDDGTTEIEQN
jgi:hypothetical protein